MAQGGTKATKSVTRLPDMSPDPSKRRTMLGSPNGSVPGSVVLSRSPLRGLTFKAWA